MSFNTALHPTFMRRLAQALAILILLGGSLTQFHPPAVQAAPLQATITVNTFTDESGTGAGCSLREAITAANTDAAFGGCPAGSGADTINLGAGTYQLSLANAGGVNEDNNDTGDLDILESLTINGAGSGATIIQAGTNTSNGIDKVIAANPFCTSGVNVTIDGLTVRFGRNTQPWGAADFSYTGGGIDWCAGGSGETFTLSNSVVSDNTNVNGYGGGLNVDSLPGINTINITNVTFSNNQTLSATNTSNGAAINLFGDQPTISITNSTFTSNHTTNVNSAGGAIYFRPTTVGSLSISGSTFSSNTAAGSGGAIATNTYGAGTTISIQNSQFTGNTATASFGGALSFDNADDNTTPFSLSHLKITGNTAGTSGGGLYVGNSNVTMSKSLIVGNSAPAGSGIHKSVDVATATVTNNWWGCSTGPGAAPCDRATTSGGTLNFTPWYRNQLTATTSPIATNQTTSLSASFLTNSANAAVPVADLTEVIARSVTWAATNGNLSGTQGSVQAAGTATGSFQATAAGTAIISAKVDNDHTSPVSSNVLSLTVNKANTTAAITNSATLNSTTSVTGEPVAVAVSVTGQYGNAPTAPTGTVTVSDGVDSCTVTLPAASCNLVFTTAGSKTITATYNGDTNFNASPASASAPHTVNKANTTTTITDSPDPSVSGQSVTFNVTVAAVSPGAVVAPTTLGGNVTITDGGTNSCVAPIVAGTGSCVITFPNAGSYSLTGTYSGDANFNASPASASEPHTVNKADTTTIITSDAPDPSMAGIVVTFNYSVTANAPDTGTPSGNVTVSDGGTNSCTGTVAAGSCIITFNTPGSYNLTASYAGDGNFKTSTSVNESHTVDKALTTTTIPNDLPDPSVVGQTITVNFTVTSPAPGTPSGNVTVSDGVDSCTGTVLSGSCSITLTTVGARTLTATYAGDTNFFGSASPGTAHTVNTANTTTTITSHLPDPSLVGESVTINFSVAPVAPGAGSPSGNVTVTDGTDSCTGTVASGSCTIAFTSTGSKTLTATYAGDSSFNGSASTTVTHAVNAGGVTITIDSDLPDPSIIGQAVTVNYAVIAALPAAGTPTGTVTISDGVDSCSNTVAAGTCPITLTTLGNRTLTASYSGDANFNMALSAGEPHTVNKAGTTTTITSHLPDPSYVGQSVTVAFTVTANPPAGGTPTGTVTVSAGTDSCSGDVATGSCTITFTSNGTKSLTASYGGDSDFDTSTSAVETHTVNLAPTTTTITSDTPDASVVGQSVTISFSVTSPVAGTPTGSVTISDGISSCTVNVAVGSCSISFTTSGAKSLTATYTGDTNYDTSTSAVESHTVDQAATTTTLSDTPDPSVVGETVTFNYTVNVNLPGAGNPTGNVNVSNGTDSCIGTVGAGSCTIALTTVGTSNFTATYAGDSNFASSTSAATPHTVNKANTTTAITSDTPDSSLVGEAVTVNFTVTPVAPGAGTPTGNVTISDGTDSCTGLISAGSCIITFSSLGTKTLTASYAGNTDFNASVSAGESHTVTKASTTIVITADTPDPSLSTGSVNVSYSIAVVAPGTGTPTGNVTVSDGVDSCVGTAAAGVCTLTLTTPGARTLTAVYAGDANFNGSTSVGEAHTVNQAPTFTSANNTTFSVGNSGTFTITTDGFPTAAITFTSSPALPASIGLVDNSDGTATLSGTPVAGDAGTYTISLTGNNGVAPNAAQTFTLTIGLAPTITSANNTTFVVGNAGIFTVTTTSFPTAAISQSGTLPSGVNFIDNGDGTATLAGTPASGSTGTYNLVLTAANGITPDATQNFTLTVEGPPGVSLVNSVVDTGDGQLTENEHTGAAITQLLVVFNKAMNAVDAQNVANYSLIQGSSTTITINSISYDNLTHTATLDVNGGTALANGKYTFTVKGTIRDSFAAPIGTDFIRIFFVDNGAPHKITLNSLPNNVLINNGMTLSTSFSRVQVTFDEDVNDTAGNTDPDDVTNPQNYLLVTAGTDGVFNTLSCSAGVAGDDIKVPINTVTYSNNSGNGPFSATVQLNNGSVLANGLYKLFVCGTTSIVDLAANPLNDGLDDQVTFTILSVASVANNPATGFAPNVVTVLPRQPAEKAYMSLGDLWIEIPNLKLKTSITGVPLKADGWDVTWLNQQVGWLEGTAYPTWNGNTVLTAHGYTADGKAGPFAFLKDLKYGETIIIHLGGMKYTYAIRSNSTISPNNTYWLTKHEKLDWITLVTCQQYDEKTKSYLYRRVVRAVLVSIEAE